VVVVVGRRRRSLGGAFVVVTVVVMVFRTHLVLNWLVSTYVFFIYIPIGWVCSGDEDRLDEHKRTGVLGFERELSISTGEDDDEDDDDSCGFQMLSSGRREK